MKFFKSKPQLSRLEAEIKKLEAEKYELKAQIFDKTSHIEYLSLDIEKIKATNTAISDHQREMQDYINNLRSFLEFFLRKTMTKDQCIVALGMIQRKEITLKQLLANKEWIR